MTSHDTASGGAAPRNAVTRACPLCPQAFDQAAAYKDHLGNAHGLFDDEGAETVVFEPVPEEAPEVHAEQTETAADPMEDRRRHPDAAPAETGWNLKALMSGQHLGAAIGIGVAAIVLAVLIGGVLVPIVVLIVLLATAAGLVAWTWSSDDGGSGWTPPWVTNRQPAEPPAAEVTSPAVAAVDQAESHQVPKSDHPADNGHWAPPAEVVEVPAPSDSPPVPFTPPALMFGPPPVDAASPAEPEPVAVVEPEPVAVVEPEPVAVVEPEPVAVVEPEPVAVVELEPVAEPEPEPVTLAEAEPEPVAVVEPEPVAEPVVDAEPVEAPVAAEAVIPEPQPTPAVAETPGTPEPTVEAATPTSPDLSPEEIAAKQFQVVGGGYAIDEVRAFLATVAASYRDASDQTVTGPVPDFAAIGEEVSRVLQAASETAESLRTKADAEAGSIRAHATEEAKAAIDEAQAAAARLRSEADRLYDDARAEATRLTAEAKQRAEAAMKEALERRDRMENTRQQLLERIKVAENMLGTLRQEWEGDEAPDAGTPQQGKTPARRSSAKSSS